MINVPLVILSDGALYPKRFDGRIGGQVDILPTIAALMDIPLQGHIHFGQNLLADRDNLIPQRYYLPSGTLITGRSLFIPGESYEDGTLYPLSGVPGDESAVTEDAFERALRLLHLSDSYIRQLPERSPEDAPQAMVPEPKDETDASESEEAAASEAGGEAVATAEEAAEEAPEVPEVSEMPDLANVSEMPVVHVPDVADATDMQDVTEVSETESAEAEEAA
jgi:hypothetical protein